MDIPRVFEVANRDAGMSVKTNTLQVVEQWDNYPVRGYCWTLGASPAGQWFLYRGPKSELQGEDRESGIGRWEWYSSEDEARMAREEALGSLKTVGNRRLVPEVARPAVAYSTLRSSDRVALSLAVPRAGVLELVLAGTGPLLRCDRLDADYLRELGAASGTGLGSIYSDLASALVEAISKSGFPLPGSLEWEECGEGLEWHGDFAGYLRPDGASLEFRAPGGTLAADVAARLWGVPVQAVLRLAGRTKPLARRVRGTPGPVTVEWSSLWEILGPPPLRKPKKGTAYFRIQLGSMEVEYKGDG
jgi:hypothetical protein